MARARTLERREVSRVVASARSAARAALRVGVFSYRNFATVVASMPVASVTSAAARAAVARATTDPVPWVCSHRWRIARTVVVLPVPAGPTIASRPLVEVTTLTAAVIWSAASGPEVCAKEVAIASASGRANRPSSWSGAVTRDAR